MPDGRSIHALDGDVLGVRQSYASTPDVDGPVVTLWVVAGGPWEANGVLLSMEAAEQLRDALDGILAEARR